MTRVVIAAACYYWGERVPPSTIPPLPLGPCGGVGLPPTDPQFHPAAGARPEGDESFPGGRCHDGLHRGAGEVRQPRQRARAPGHQSLQGRGAAVFQPALFLRAVGQGERLLLRVLLRQVNAR